MDQELQQQVLIKLGIESLPEEERDEILALTLDAIIKQAVLLAHDTLPEDKRDLFVNLVENGGDLGELIEYFSQTIDGKPILTRAVEEVLAELEGSSDLPLGHRNLAENVIPYLVVEHYAYPKEGYMLTNATFFIVDTTLSLSLRTHCPIMVRIVTEGHHFPEEVCRCDIPALKKELHPFRCPSNNGCPVRKHEKFSEDGLCPRYELL